MQHGISLRPFNTFGIHVNARHFSRFNSTDELRDLLASATVRTGPLLILGGGSNILFTRDFEGTVLRNELKGISVVGEDDNHWLVRAAAGEVWHQFVVHCIENDWAGLENLSLIPGSVGASPMQNIGAYGVEIKDVFHSLEAMHVHDRTIREFNATECAFGYRESVFKRKEKDQWVITSVTFRLNKRPEFHTAYGAIQEELDKMHLDKLTIKAVSDAVIRIRTSKLPDPSKLGNAGSFFKNPVVAETHYRTLRNTYADLPCYPVDETHVKVPAGWLIERAGWKGKRIGACGVHEKQALVIVNYGGAGGDEVLALSSSIIASVEKMFGITLEREVNIL